MASLHELKARSCPKPDQHRMLIGPSGNPDSYYGWQEARRLQEPTPTFHIVQEGEITRNMIASAMRGDFRAVEQPNTQKPKTAADIEYQRLKKERETRRKIAHATRISRRMSRNQKRRNRQINQGIRMSEES